MDDSPESGPPKKEPLTLPGLFRKLSPMSRPGLLAYLAGLLLVCVMALAQIWLADVMTDSVRLLSNDTPIVPWRQQIVPNPDGLRWIVYTQDAIQDGHPLRLSHWTFEDGFDEGRYVGWSSPPMWWLEALAGVRHAFTGEDFLCCVTSMSAYYCPLLWVLTAALLGALCVRVYGWSGAIIVPLLMAVLSPLSYSNRYSVFCPDHHLIILIAALGVMVCFSAPFVKEGRTRVPLWFAGAAVFNALGMWVSAPTQTLVLIGLFLGFLFVPSAAVRMVPAFGWRLFAYLSSFLTLAACWWEYHPDIPLHVETNSPVYAAGVLVAGILFWQMHEFAASGRRFDSLNVRVLVYSALLLLMAALPVVVYMPYLFSMADPYHIRWMALLPEEFPLDFDKFLINNLFLCLAVVLAVYAFVTWRKELRPGGKVAVAMSLGLLLTYGYFGISRLRFLDHVILGLVVFLVVAVPRNRARFAGWVLAAALVPCFSGWQSSVAECRTIQTNGTDSLMENFSYVRICGEYVLRASHGAPVKVLAPIEESNMLNYHTGCKVLGTGYWENNDALIESCRIFFDGSPNWMMARNKIRRDGIDVIVVPIGFPFLHSSVLFGHDPSYSPERSFAMCLTRADPKTIPAWLKLEYRDSSFLVYRVNRQDI